MQRLQEGHTEKAIRWETRVISRLRSTRKLNERETGFNYELYKNTFNWFMAVQDSLRSPLGGFADLTVCMYSVFLVQCICCVLYIIYSLTCSNNKTWSTVYNMHWLILIYAFFLASQFLFGWPSEVAIVLQWTGRLILETKLASRDPSNGVYKCKQIATGSW